MPVPPRYAVRELRQDDAPALAAAYRRNWPHLEPWEPPRPSSYFTDDGQARVVSDQLAAVEQGRQASWVLVRTDTGTGDDDSIVGRVNLTNIALGPARFGSLGYWVDAQHLRRGLAGTGLDHAIHWARDHGLHRLEAGTVVHNTASQKVLRSRGFRHYGRATGYLFIAGAWRDHDLFELILHDDPLS